MPWKSDAQRRWGNSPAGHKALGDAGVKEWNAASKGEKVPSRIEHVHEHLQTSKKPEGRPPAHKHDGVIHHYADGRSNH
jgi:hypothetical protein